uniref:Uncharacterized protein n=1 Tax=Oryza nivara TaxID=4536 RepID=A0A0E0FSI7_ORYNI
MQHVQHHPRLLLLQAIDQWLTGWTGIDDGGARSESDKTVVDLPPRCTILGEDDETKLVAQQLIRIRLEAVGGRKTLLLGHGSSS